MIPLHFHLAVLRTGKVSYSTSKSRFIPLPASANTGRGENLFPIYSLLYLWYGGSLHRPNVSPAILIRKWMKGSFSISAAHHRKEEEGGLTTFCPFEGQLQSFQLCNSIVKVSQGFLCTFRFALRPRISFFS